jgi:hypothetical protein
MNPTFTLVVTGGTGAYSRDSRTVDFNASGNTQTLSVHLTGEPAR